MAVDDSISGFAHNPYPKEEQEIGGSNAGAFREAELADAFSPQQYGT